MTLGGVIVTDQRYRILILEDEPAHARLLETILKSVGEITIARDTERFFEILGEQPPPDLCIVDNRIESDPHFVVGEAGLQAIETLHSFLRLDITTIFCTGYPIMPEHDKVLAELGIPVLRKPFSSPAEVRDFVRLQLEGARTIHSKEQTIERHGVAWFSDLAPDGVMMPVQQYHLAVQITEALPTETTAKSVPLQLRDILPLDILVLVVGEGFEVNPQGGHIIRVPTIDDSEPVIFKVVPKEDVECGLDRALRVHFYFQREWLQCIDFDLRVAASFEDIGLTSPPGEPTALGRTSLRVNTELSGKPDLSLHWYNTATNPRGLIIGTHTAETAFDHLSGSDWEDLNKKLRTALVQVEAEAGKQENSSAFDNLVEVGGLAYSRIFNNEDIRRALSRKLYQGVVAGQRPPYIFVWTDRHHLVPWNLLFFGKDVPGNGNDARHFWGMGCIVEQACVGSTKSALQEKPTRRDFPLQIGILWNQRFQSVRACELELLRQIGSNGQGVIEFDVLHKAEPHEELAEFLQRPWDIVEFACHSVLAENPLDSCLELSGGTRIPLWWLLAGNFRFSKCPQVVISSCNSLHFDARRTASFFQGLIDVGAQGVLGTLVPVRARFASRFVTNVYHYWFNGHDIGRAVCKARNDCWQRMHSLLGLAYAQVGDARIQMPDIVSTQYEECRICVSGGCLEKYSFEGDAPF